MVNSIDNPYFEEHEYKIRPVVEYLEELLAANKAGLDLAESGDAIDAQTKHGYTPEEIQRDISVLVHAIMDLKHGKPEKALNVLMNQLTKTEEHTSEPFGKWREDAKPTDPKLIEEDQLRTQQEISRLKSMIQGLH